MLLVGLNII